MQACATGRHVKEATITHRKAGKDQQDYLIIKMNDIIITGVTDGDASGQAGSETVSLAFAKIDLEYKPQKADGSLDTGIHFKYRPQSQQRRLGSAPVGEGRKSCSGGSSWSTQKLRHAS